jgi:hypothetical protein
MNGTNWGNGTKERNWDLKCKRKKIKERRIRVKKRTLPTKRKKLKNLKTKAKLEIYGWAIYQRISRQAKTKAGGETLNGKMQKNCLKTI